MSWIEDLLRRAIHSERNTVEAVFLGDEGMRDLAVYAQRYPTTQATLMTGPAIVDPARVIQFMGLAVVPITSPAAPPWRVELHTRRHDGSAHIVVVR